MASSKNDQRFAIRFSKPLETGQTHGWDFSSASATQIWRNHTPGSMVDSTRDGIPWADGLRALCQLGRVPGSTLSPRFVSVAVLLAALGRRSAACVVRPAAVVVAAVVAVLAGL